MDSKQSTTLESKRLCECGCGRPTIRNNRFIHGHNQTGFRSWQWNGGTFVRDGYRWILYKEHPNADHHGYIQEHRFVMELFIGRLVLDNEDVHHINGDTLDNRIENLQLLTHGQHSYLTNSIDMSDRCCHYCRKNTSSDRSWYKVNDGQYLICLTCYDKKRRDKLCLID